MKNAAFSCFTFLVRKTDEHRILQQNSFSQLFVLGMIKSQGVVSEDGTKIYSWGIWNKIETLSWQSQEDLEKLAIDRDPIEAPSCHYKIQPENQGKLVWISGPPGK